jgi:hypothetical protein
MRMLPGYYITGGNQTSPVRPSAALCPCRVRRSAPLGPRPSPPRRSMHDGFGPRVVGQCRRCRLAHPGPHRVVGRQRKRGDDLPLGACAVAVVRRRQPPVTAGRRAPSADPARRGPWGRSRGT